jgi:ribosomal protein S18 acetylase RimI-like enzyme
LFESAIARIVSAVIPPFIPRHTGDSDRRQIFKKARRYNQAEEASAGDHMEPEIFIRPFRPADQSAAKALILEGLTERWGFRDPVKNPDLDDIAASYARGVFLVAELGERLVGTGAMLPGTEGTAEICRMSVARARRRQGIGGAILGRLVENARAAGYRKLILETTSTWEDAVAFYRKHGFRRTHVREGDTYFVLELNPRPASVV